MFADVIFMFLSVHESLIKKCRWCSGVALALVSVRERRRDVDGAAGGARARAAAGERGARAEPAAGARGLRAHAARAPPDAARARTAALAALHALHGQEHKFGIPDLVFEFPLFLLVTVLYLLYQQKAIEHVNYLGL